MGAGIAIVTARAGFETVSYDLKQETLEGAAKQTAGFFGKSVERGKMTGEEHDAVLARMSTTTDLAALGECDLVIEAVFEDLGIKHLSCQERAKRIGRGGHGRSCSTLPAWAPCWDQGATFPGPPSLPSSSSLGEVASRLEGAASGIGRRTSKTAPRPGVE